MARKPEKRRCYNCQVKQTIVGKICNQPICGFCFPFLDTRAVEGIINFDMKHGNYVRI